MNLFEQEESNAYFEKLKNELKISIKNLSDTQILTTNFNELIEYYKSKFYIEPLHLHMDKISTNIEKSKVQKYNHFYGMGYNEPKFFDVDSCKINYNIPFSGSSNLLHLTPSQRILSRFIIDGFDNLYNSNFLPSIRFSLNIDMNTLEQNSNPQEYIDSTFKREFNSYQSMVDYVNNDVNSYNNSLTNYITTLLNDRKNKADSFSGLMQKLNIPLKMNPNAPNITPIPLIAKKEIKSFPEQSYPEKNWCISDKDYSTIKNIISQACTSYEHSPGACQKLNEEELRDFLLANLNTHYNSSATGETFSKRGKTDIRIQFENKSAYIAECKIWHGISQFRNAIDQLFSYATWRDIKTSLIVFNKEIKDFSSIIDKIKNELENNSLKMKVSEISKNEWQCTFKRSLDSQELIELHIILCDISL